MKGDVKSGLQWLILSRETFRVSLNASRNDGREKENLTQEKDYITAGAKSLIGKKGWDLVHECTAGLRRSRTAHAL